MKAAAAKVKKGAPKVGKIKAPTMKAAPKKGKY